MRVARVAADPAICPEAGLPGGWAGIRYRTLHGSPVLYRSGCQGKREPYAEELKRAAAQGENVWCIFDNTASSAAIADALALSELINRDSSEI